MSHIFDVAGKSALVTGGTRGLGYEIASGLVRAGVNVIVTSRRSDDCSRVADELSASGWCRGIPGDLRTESGVATLAARVGDVLGSLSMLINNAGAVTPTPLAASGSDAWDSVVDVNLKAPFYLTRELLPHLERAGSAESPSRVINIGSMEGLRVSGLPIHSYAASKAGLHHLTRVLAKELGPRHVTVNAIAPGTFAFGMSAGALTRRAAALQAETVLGRLGNADDIVGAVQFLSSRAGAFVTGVVIPVDGGASTCL